MQLNSLRSVAALFLLALSPLVSATTHIELQGGRSFTNRHGTNTAFINSTFSEHVIGDSRFTWAPDVSLGWIDGRSTHKYENEKYNLRNTVWLLAGGARFRYGTPADWYHGFFFGAQGAVLDGQTIALSSRGEFVSTLGWQSGPVSFQLRHISNAGIHEPNRGETMALIGIGFDF